MSESQTTVERVHRVARDAGRNVKCTCGAEYSLMRNLMAHIAGEIIEVEGVRVERYWDAHGRRAVRYLEPDTVRGIAAGSDILEPAAPYTHVYSGDTAAYGVTLEGRAGAARIVRIVCTLEGYTGTIPAGSTVRVPAARVWHRDGAPAVSL